MKKKVIGFITLLLVLLLGLSINTYAFSNINDFENDLKSKLNILKENGVIASGFSYNNVSTPYDQYFDYILMLRTQDKQSNGTYSKIFIGYWRRAKHNPIVNASYNNTWGYSDTYVVVKGFNTQNGSLTDSAWTPGLRGWSFDYVYTTIGIETSNMTLGEGEEFGEYYITTPPVAIAFEDYSDGSIEVYYNGSSDTFLKYNLSRSVNSWALGKITGYDNEMQIDVRLNRYMNGEFTTNVGHAQWYNGQFTTFGGLSITGDGVVYINNDKIYYQQGYYLTIDLNGENVFNFPIYFLPYASTLVSGELLSPDIDTNSDLEILQNLQELVNIQNIGAIYDNYFSGDSGDVLGSLGYNDYDNQYQVYMADILDELHNVLMTSGDVSVNVSLMGVPMTLHSSDYTVPNNAIKIFCNSFLTFGLFYYIYKTAVHFFHQLQEGNFVGAVNTYTVDDESVYM